MSGNNLDVAVAPSNMPVKFLGRINDVPHSDVLYLQTVNQLVNTTNELKSVANKDDSWNSLSNEMVVLANYFANPDQTIKRYQVELVADGLLPYLKKLNGRIHFDKKRFKQINAIIHAVMNNNVDHPAQSLQALDEVVLDLKSNKAYLWKSELLTLLETAVDKQWQPIIADNKAILQNIGGKFLMVGLIGVVGWPMAFMYPLYRVALNMARIASEYEKKKTITMETGIEVAKTLAVIFAATQLLSILSVYSALGYFCLVCGIAAVVISANKTWIKQLVPVMAPHVIQIDQVLSLIGSIDHTKMRDAMMDHAATAAGDVPAPTSKVPAVGSRPVSTTTFTSPRVEELPDKRIVNSAKSGSSSRDTNAGEGSSRVDLSSSKYSNMSGDDLMDVIDGDDDPHGEVMPGNAAEESAFNTSNSRQESIRKRK